MNGKKIGLTGIVGIIFYWASIAHAEVITKDVSTYFGFDLLVCEGTTDTTVYNKTPFSIEIVGCQGGSDDYNGNAHALPDAINVSKGFIEAGKKYKVLSILRACPESSKSTDFGLKIMLPYVGEIVLQEKVTYKSSGKSHRIEAGSDLDGISLKTGELSTADNAFNMPWYKSGTHTETVIKGNKKFHIKYYMYFTGGYDNVWCEITYEGPH